ncbi:hypothetical protein [Alteraurantiacibacter aestuarii]|uniref:hypothetical protein n=1 Tax=Alteraurantiacibacter aestuarii TaxID=650004 RepID=UPI0031CFA8D8
MKRLAFASLGAIAAVAVASPAMAQAGCSRESLQDLADTYVEAQTLGEGFRVPMGEWVQYRENNALSSMTFGGVLADPHEVDWYRAFLDTQTCNIFVELIVDDAESPWVLGTKISTRGGLVNRYDVVTSTKGDWLFDASKTLEYAQGEDWRVIPEADRLPREAIIAAADAYLDRFNDTSVEVPWGPDCARLEGGMTTPRDAPGSTCDLGIPEGIQLVDRDYIVDEALGAVAVRLRFGSEDGLSDAHIFRVESDGIRYIHTITNCGGVENCGFPPLGEVPGS